MNTTRSQWSSTYSYLLVTIGAVVGLGNLIQFPFLVSKFGGMFILCFIFFEIVITIPLFLSDLLMGRRGKQNPVGTISLLAMESQASYRWSSLGWFCTLIAFFTLCYYSVQAAFPLAYLIGSIKALYAYGVDEMIPVAINGKMLTDFFPLELCFLLFLTTTMWVIVRGINRGLEAISKTIIPFYFCILFLLAMFTVSQVGLVESFAPLFKIHSNVELLTVISAALVYAFFKLGIGLGTMIVYGSYMPYSTSYGRSTAIIVLFDIVISLLAYLVLYPLMISTKTDSFIGNLTNHNLIYVFSGISYGILIAFFYFLVAVLAAWTCTIAMAETVTVTLIERFSLSRPMAGLIVYSVAILLGSFAALTHTKWLGVMLTEHLTLSGLLKNVTGNLLVPIAAFFIAIFVSRVLKQAVTRGELQLRPWGYRLWYISVRYISPILILCILLM